MKDEAFTIHTDGGARGNPGPAAVGVVITNQAGEEIASYGKAIGDTTNNVAEYTAVIEALLFLKNNNYASQKISFYLDSQLVVSQINGVFKVKQLHLQQLVQHVKRLLPQVSADWSFVAIPREQNQRADELVNKALDELK